MFLYFFWRAPTFIASDINNCVLIAFPVVIKLNGRKACILQREGVKSKVGKGSENLDFFFDKQSYKIGDELSKLAYKICDEQLTVGNFVFFRCYINIGAVYLSSFSRPCLIKNSLSVSTMYSFWWQTVQDGSVASARSGDFGIWEIVKIYVPLAAKTLISLPEKSVSCSMNLI